MGAAGQSIGDGLTEARGSRRPWPALVRMSEKLHIPNITSRFINFPAPFADADGLAFYVISTAGPISCSARRNAHYLFKVNTMPDHSAHFGPVAVREREPRSTVTPRRRYAPPKLSKSSHETTRKTPFPTETHGTLIVPERGPS